MRKIYEMPSNNLKLWQIGNETLLEVKGDYIRLSEMEVEDLISTLIKLQADIKHAKDVKEVKNE